MEYCLTPAPSLNCEVVHVGRQADASAMEKLDNCSPHKGHYLWETFETEGWDLPFVLFPLLFKSNKFLDRGTHGDIEESILEIQPRTHGVFLELFPDYFYVFHTQKT